MSDRTAAAEEALFGGGTGSSRWYPCPPPGLLPEIPSSIASHMEEEKEVVLPPVHPLWRTKLTYTSSNLWDKQPVEVLEKSKRHRVHGVEVRDLPPNHPLHGEQGLFATQKFFRFDILGEYTGRIVGDDFFGHYVAALEDKGHDKSLGIDAQYEGNEMRFINSYLGIAFGANVTMRTCYTDTIPRIILVCTQDIEIGEEFLLDYGHAYNAAYLLPPNKIVCAMSQEQSESAWQVLPGGDGSGDEEEEKQGKAIDVEVEADNKDEA